MQGVFLKYFLPTIYWNRCIWHGTQGTSLGYLPLWRGIHLDWGPCKMISRSQQFPPSLLVVLRDSFFL